MKTFRTHLPELALAGTATALTLVGFWTTYFGPQAEANAYHHLHLATVLAWLGLLVCQVLLIGSGKPAVHRKVGWLVLLAAPLLVASAALLSVESARKGLASGRGDFMIVQNVMGTLQLALLIVAAFVLRRRRALHGALLASTALLFLGIAMFFTLIGVVPGFRIEGPETFHRFGTALATVQYVVLALGVLLFARRPRQAWPFLLVGAFPLLNEFVRAGLAQRGLIGSLTEAVGSLHQPLTFTLSFVVILALLAATVVPGARARDAASGPGRHPGPVRP